MRNIILRLALPLIILPILSIQILILQALPHVTPAMPQTTTVDYVITSTLLPNPERGFYHHTETHSNNYTSLDLATLQDYRQYENITLEELSRFHWSYLNIDYHLEVIDSWNTFCLDDIKRQLGHRLALVEGVYQDAVQPGDTFTVEIKLQNAGWAAPLNPRPVELLLRHKTGGKICRVKLPDDLRFWLPEQGEISLVHTIRTSAGWSPGQYELLLNLPDPEPSLYSIPAYAIRLANEMVWEQSTGYNNLSHTLMVTGPAISPDPDNVALSAVCDILYLPLILKS